MLLYVLRSLWNMSICSKRDDLYVPTYIRAVSNDAYLAKNLPILWNFLLAKIAKKLAKLFLEYFPICSLANLWKVK